jgi:hypothetical protein
VDGNAVQPVELGSAAFSSLVVYSNSAPATGSAYVRLLVSSALRSPPLITFSVPLPLPPEPEA